MVKKLRIRKLATTSGHGRWLRGLSEASEFFGDVAGDAGTAPGGVESERIRKRLEEHLYLLVTAFVGRKAELEPWDSGAFAHASNPEAARQRSVEFWNTHALIYNADRIVPGTEVEGR